MRNLIRENAVRRGGRECSIAVAVDKDKTSQFALKWAVDNVVEREQTLKLVHVKDRPPIPYPTTGLNDETLMEQQTDNQVTDLLLPFRCFCRRRQVQCDSVVLEDPDVAKALIEYVCQFGIETLLLGAGSRTGLSRLFKAADIPGNVLKWAPDFCTVYIISKGKISAVRNATRPLPAISAAGGALLAQRNLSLDLPSSMEAEKWFDELSAPDTDIPYGSTGRRSTDSTFFAFYENLGTELTRNFSSPSSLEGRDFEPLPAVFRSPVELSFGSELNRLDSGSTLEFAQKSEDYDCELSSLKRELKQEYCDDELRRLKTELKQEYCDNELRRPNIKLKQEDHDDELRKLKTQLKQTMDLYHAACEEALTAKQKAMELEEWKMREEKRLQEANLAKETESEMEREKTKWKVAAEAAKKHIEKEVQKRVKAETKALKEAEEKKKVLDALGQSHIVLKYQSLFHVIAVLFLFYFYSSLFK